MSNEINAEGASGLVLYATVRDAVGRWWNTSSVAFETYSAGNWGDYAISLAETGLSGVYQGDFPSDVVAFGRYRVSVRQQSGGSAAVSDEIKGSSAIDWDGDAEILPVDASLIDVRVGSRMSGTAFDTNVIGSLKTMLEDGSDPSNSRFTVDALSEAPAGSGGGGGGTLDGPTIAAIATAVWSNATRSLTTFGTLASTVATSVWSAGSRTLTAFGFTVDATVDTDALVVAIWAALVSDAPFTTSGTAGATILAILARLNAIGTGQVSIVAPVAANGDATVYLGADYDDGTGHPLIWSVPTPTFPDLTGKTVTMVQVDKETIKVATITGPGTTNQAVKVELKQADLAALGRGSFAFYILAELGTESSEDDFVVGPSILTII